ncbi:MAG: hypothetical protein KAS32_05880, partial [Candidatus Peribacteraceae bacterium]|nr:hypothetical protein [Candidatus Peribacteraceae bacterium]
MEVAKLYNGEVTLNFEPTKHIYEVDGERKVSVTGVTGVVNKPALTWWAAHEAGREIIEVLTGGIFSAKDKKTYRVKEGEIPQTPQLDEVSIEKLYQDARFAHYRKKTTAADIGTLVHNWVERYIKGENPTMPANDKVKNGVDAFLKWEK